MSGVAQVDGHGDGVDGDVDRTEFGAVIVAPITDFLGDLTGEVQVPVGGSAIVVPCCRDGEDELAGPKQRLSFWRRVA